MGPLFIYCSNPESQTNSAAKPGWSRTLEECIHLFFHHVTAASFDWRGGVDAAAFWSITSSVRPNRFTVFRTISSNYMACSRGESGTTDVHVDLPVMSTTTTKRPEERWRGRPGESLRLISIYLRGNTIYTDIIHNWHSFFFFKKKQIMFYFSPEWLIYKCIL